MRSKAEWLHKNALIPEGEITEIVYSHIGLRPLMHATIRHIQE